MLALERLGELVEESGRANTAGSAAMALRFALEGRELRRDQRDALEAVASLLEKAASQNDTPATERRAGPGISTLRQMRAVEVSVAQGPSSRPPAEALRSAAVDLRTIHDGQKLEPERVRALIKTVEHIMGDALTAAWSIRSGSL